MYRPLSDVRNGSLPTESVVDEITVWIELFMAGNDLGDSSVFSRSIMYGVDDAQISGGLDETGRESVLKMDVAGKSMILRPQLVHPRDSKNSTEAVRKMYLTLWPVRKSHCTSLLSPPTLHPS